MSYKITWLGSGGSRYVTAHQLRATGGIVFNFNKLQIHLDPGPGALVRAKQFGINVNLTDLILVSHHHIDHCNDLNAVIDAMTIGGITKKGILISNKDVIDGFDGEKPSLSNYHRNALKKIIILKEGEKFKVNNLAIKALKTFNHEKNNIGFKFITEKFILSYTSDTDFSDELIKEHKDSNIIIVNNQASFKKKYKGYLYSKDTVNLLEKVKPKLAIISHFGKTVIDANPIYEAREIQKLSGVQTIAADDGLVVDPISYSATLKQKTLDLY